MNELKKGIDQEGSGELTNQTSKGYPRGGDIFMPDGPVNTEGQSSQDQGKKENVKNSSENQGQSRGGPQEGAVNSPVGFDENKFGKKAEELKSSVGRQEFKNFIDLVKATPAREMKRTWDQFDNLTKNLNASLFEEYSKLRDVETDKNRKTEIEGILKTLGAEEGIVRRLMQEKAYMEETDEPLVEDQTNLVRKIEQEKRLLESGTGDSETIKRNIRENAGKLYDTLLKRPPEDTSVGDEVMKALGADELATEKFINRLIFMPIENESHHMSGFYSQSNLDKFFKINNPDVIGKERYDRLKALVEANQTFHNMNYVLKRSFDQFSQLAQSILPEQIGALSNIAGVSEVFHLYERFSQEHLGIEARITQTEFDKMDEEVRANFEEMNREGIIMGGMEGKNLEYWETQRAIAYGRNLFRISVRAAEHVSHSELPGNLPGLGTLPGDGETYISPPQKELVGILNNIKFFIYRFQPNKELGGFELIDSVREKRMKARRESGSLRIKTLQGTDVDMRSLENIVGARGYMYTWRMREALLRNIKFSDKGRVTSVVDFFIAHKNEISAVSSEADAQRVFAPLLEGNQLALGVMLSAWAENVPKPLKALLWKKVASVDPLVMSSMLTRLELDKYDTQKAKDVEKLDGVKSMEEIILDKWGTSSQKERLGGGKYQILRADLRKTDAELEKLRKQLGDMEHPYAAKVPKMEQKLKEVKASGKYLKLQDEIKKKSVEYDQKKAEYGQLDMVVREVLRCDKWEIMKKKLTKAHEKRIHYETAHMGEEPRSLTFYLAGDLALSAEEQDVYKQIKENGERIAGDLSNCSQPTTWFMDDVPLSLIKWDKMGQTYDRMVNDLGAFQKSNQASNQVLGGRVFNEPPAEVAKHLSEAIARAGDVLGRAGSAQDNFYDVVKQYLEMIQERPRHRAMLKSEIKHSLMQPTSRAQEITGSMDTPATDEAETFDVVKELLNLNVLRKTVRAVTDDKDDHGKILYENQVGEVMKKYHLGWMDRLVKKNWRDFKEVGFLAFLIAFLKKTFSGLEKSLAS